LEEGQLISVKNVSLPKATFVKFRAQSCDFLEITNHRAVLEVTLRKFTCLTEGDQICIAHGGANYFLDIREVKPNGAASIIETDCNVDFEEPVGYKAWEESKAQERSGNASGRDEKSTSGGAVVSRTLQRARVVSEEEAAAAKNAFKPFAGSAKRIDGRQVPSSAAEGKDSKESGKDSSSSSSKDIPYGGSGPSSASSSAREGIAAAPAAAAPAGPTYQSRIGDKFSKKKAVLTAMKDPTQKFAGPANTLAGDSGKGSIDSTLGRK
jgi:ubiquitin fusion degradation protein 1